LTKNITFLGLSTAGLARLEVGIVVLKSAMMTTLIPIRMSNALEANY
jgi:hypothetical protein